MAVHTCVREPSEFTMPSEATEGIGFLGTGVTGDHKPPDAGAKNRIWALWKNSESPRVLSPSPEVIFLTNKLLQYRRCPFLT